MNELTNFHQTQSALEITLRANRFPILREFSKRVLKFKFTAHYHPYTDELIEKLNRDGLPAMLDANYHKSLEQDLTNWYTIGPNIILPFPKEEIDVSDDGPYSVYNWELFFHAPLAVAVHLSKNRRFAEAQKWFHFIFDPTDNDKTTPSPQRFWKFLRFRNETKTEFIQEMLKKLAEGTDIGLKKRMEKSIQAMRRKPFNPYVIARTRYVAFQMNVIMAYLDNLIAWGDNLFRTDTVESLNEATQIYVLAANILGIKPQRVPPRGKRVNKTFNQLKTAGIDAFGNALIDVENNFPFNTSPTSSGQAHPSGASTTFGIGRNLYFCIPQNDKLLSYWDTVADRLFKIRHCMNIEGVVRQLPLFDPPIDPGALINAAAAGFDIGSIVNNINQPLSTVRGPLLLQKAMEICQEVKALGGALLSAFEKKDAESLGMIRQKHEIHISNLTRDLKFLQWKESEAATEGLLKSRNTAFERYRHSKKMLGANDSDINALKTVALVRRELTEDTFDAVYAELVGAYAIELAREDYRKETSVGGVMEFGGNLVTGIVGNELGKTLPLNKNENAELNIFLPSYDTFSTLSLVLEKIAPLVALIPQFGAHATPVGLGARIDFGGVQLKAMAKEGALISQKVASAFAASAERAAKMGGYYRKAEEQVSQANSATSELEQFGRQIISSLIREQITKKEYENHLIQMEQSEEIRTFLEDKFTNEELYVWMKGEISKIYFACYQFAYDVAKKSEQTLKHELMRKEFDDQNFIKFGYWGSAKQGLLAGESLYLDLKRMEMAYLESNKREYELTENVSLHRLDPLALLQLKATGAYEFDIPEWLYDMNSPGQYNRRIKTVSVSIPCITGPHTSIHAKLTLLTSSIRTSSLLGGGYKRTVPEDNRFRDFNGAIDSMVTSTAQNDSGLFETNLRDDKYLPFEGAGGISRWRIEIPNEIPQFDFESITDVVLHIRYTCREGGDQLKEAATKYINDNIMKQPPGLIQLFDINHEFGTEWQLFRTAASDATRKLALRIDKGQFPYWTSELGMDKKITVTFCTIDLITNVLTQRTDVPMEPPAAGTGWNLVIDKTSQPGLFDFLKDADAGNRIAYMTASYGKGTGSQI